MVLVSVNVFGTPITQGDRIQRAHAAAKNPNADGRLDEMLRVSQQSDRDDEDNVNITYIHIHNATGDPITFTTKHNWEGHVGHRYPNVIENGQWARFKHVGTPKPNREGSIGAVVYNIWNMTDSLIAWSNPIDTKNTVFCEMEEPGFFNKPNCDWNKIYHAVRDCGFHYETSMQHFTTKVLIDKQGPKPKYWAHFKLAAG